ncbi:PKD domain-containing protein [Sorangium sp. So ce1153]|uniref:PKD domain-containing protein n=1 Tax=Sorangium sp. So ce1153 TaxID=3133333 RepID=UPI003F62678A
MLLIAALANPAAAAPSSKLRVREGLAFNLGPLGAPAEPLAFVVSAEGKIKDFEVLVEEIYGPDGKSLASPAGIVATAERRASDRETSWMIKLVTDDNVFASPGNYQVTLRLSGVAMDASAPSDAGMPSASESIATTVTLKRPETLESASPLVVRLLRPTPFSSAATTISWQVRSKRGTTIEPCAATLESVYERTRFDKGERLLGPGTVRVDADSSACKAGTLKLVFEGFDRTGEFASAAVLEAPALGRGPTRIPLLIEVTDDVWAPLAVITLGVGAAFGLDYLNKRWRPAQETMLRILRLSTQLERLRRLVEKPPNTTELTALAERLSRIETQADSSKSGEELDEIENRLSALQTQQHDKILDLWNRLDVLGRSAATLASMPEFVDETKKAREFLLAERVDPAEESVKKCEDLAAAAPAGGPRFGRAPESGAATPREQGPTLDVKDSHASRVVGSRLSFVLAASDATQIAGDQFAWEFGDGARETTSRPRATHEYGRPGRFAVKVSVLAGGAEVAKVETSISVAPSARDRAMVQFDRRMKWVDLGVSTLALGIATLSALTTTYYNGKLFGTFGDYAGAFLWGFGMDASLRGLANVVGALRQGSSRT